MTIQKLPYAIHSNALQELLAFCSARQFTRFVLVCDERTHAALGARVESALRDAGWDVLTACLPGAEVTANEQSLVQTMLKTDQAERVYLAVGSGTITDITRFVSYKARANFISLPTAASVDGYFSTGAPLVIGGLKQTYYTHAPLAVFADLPTLCQAPGLLSAAGFGDMLGKFLSLADWRLGHLLWDERYDPAIVARVQQAVAACISHADGIRSGQPDAIRVLMEGLVESGFCMLEFGNSYPASGAEHHISHYWEMLLLNQGRPAIFHGLKVGAACVLTSRWYADLRRLTRDQAARRLNPLPNPGQEERSIRAGFGAAAEAVITDQQPFLSLTPARLAGLQDRILANWDAVQEIARTVPEPDTLAGWLQAAGCPVHAEALGISSAEVGMGLRYGHYVRPRFTINKLRQYLHLDFGLRA